MPLSASPHLPYYPYPFPLLYAFRHLPKLCTMQYSCHCPFTFAAPRKASRSSPLQYAIFANTGSIICIRQAYRSWYSCSLSFSRIVRQQLPCSLLAVISSGLPLGFLGGFFLCPIHFSLHGHRRQSVTLARYVFPRPRSGPPAPLYASLFPHGHS